MQVNETKVKLKSLKCDRLFLITYISLCSLVNGLQTLHSNSCASVQIVLQIYIEIACGNSSNAKCA